MKRSSEAWLESFSATIRVQSDSGQDHDKSLQLNEISQKNGKGRVRPAEARNTGFINP